MIRLTASPYAIDIESSFDGLSSPYLNIYPQLIHRIGPCLPLSSYSLQSYSFYGFTLGNPHMSSLSYPCLTFSMYWK